ncbi:isoprenylcysteine carboxyl methyltransferase family protein [Campylobacter sp.]|uniref:isoprenylcysteine carboxyl methyltransferase family protein n=1 Tax=Campylobacter sp. TaxID=205 RepID=UPI00270CC63B|nr:isoprenylcysteine carboxyl methyltransferase family protein [Campylobacter sp.]
MQYNIQIIVLAIFIVRLAFLKLSKDNEKSILANGGREYGADNSKRLAILHVLFYFSCLAESIFKKAAFDTQSLVGFALVVFALLMLYVVTRLLKGIWTVKLMIAKEHKFNDHWLFRVVKHPNYFLNIAPELIGLALLCHAPYSAVVILPFYVFVLYKRIEEENRLIAEVIIPNGKI